MPPDKSPEERIASLERGQKDFEKKIDFIHQDLKGDIKELGSQITILTKTVTIMEATDKAKEKVFLNTAGWVKWIIGLLAVIVASFFSAWTAFKLNGG